MNNKPQHQHQNDRRVEAHSTIASIVDRTRRANTTGRLTTTALALAVVAIALLMLDRNGLMIDQPASSATPWTHVAGAPDAITTMVGAGSFAAQPGGRMGGGGGGGADRPMGMHDMQMSDATPPTLHIRGEAELEKPADQIVISIAVITEAASAAEASSDNREKVEDVMDALEKLDLGADALRTRNYRVEPIWDYRQPERQNRNEPFEPRIRGYRVNNTVEVETMALDQTSAILRSAIEAGANTINSLRFELSDKRLFREEAIQTAVRHARSDAAVLAEAAGVRFRRVLSIQLDDAVSVFPQPYQMAKFSMAESAPRGMATSRGMAADSVESGDGDMGLGGLGENVTVEAIPEIIEPGTVTVRATVTILYEIETINTNLRSRP
ncbi:MAG: SIMPL domain-containing protein [Planctomycetota bacterium]